MSIDDFVSLQNDYTKQINNQQINNMFHSSIDQCFIIFLIGLMMIELQSTYVDCLLKKNRFTDLMTDVKNYQIDDTCNGIKFPNDLNGSVGLDEKITNVQEIFLPNFGNLIFEDGASIEFVDKHTKHCMNMKARNGLQWVDINSWQFINENNTSVPDVERIPCDHDDVSTRGVYNHIFPENDITVKTYTYHTTMYLTKSTFTFRHGNKLFVTGDNCSAKSGCVCHKNKKDLENEICEYVAQKPSYCMEPIKPVGFCHTICGGYIHVDVNDKFDIKDFRNKLPKYSYSNVYVSRVQLEKGEIVQVVFTDKNGVYDAYSAEDTEDFKANLLKDLSSYSIKSVVSVQMSGLPYYPGKSAKKAFTIVLITMLMNIVLFGAIFYYYHSEHEMFRINFPSRFNLFSGTNLSQHIPRSFTFARFDNRDEISLNGDSIGGSVISLEKAFDNPMYNQSSTSIDEEASTSTSNLQQESITCNTDLDDLNEELNENIVVDENEK